jgi:anti-sigma B factor antagonist
VRPGIRIRNLHGVSVVDVIGQVVMGTTSQALRDTIAELLMNHERNILLNLGGVTYIDSSGIGEFVRSSNMVEEQGGKLKLLNVPKRIRDLMRLSRIVQLFEVYEDEGKAVASFT